MQKEEYYKKAKEPADFTNLLSDNQLRKDISELIFEDISDKECVGRICQQTSLSEAQRNWFLGLIKRKGKKNS